MPQGSLSSPVLSSPELAVQSARRVLDGLRSHDPRSEQILVAAAGRETRR
jgi:hypothetical protein